MGQYVVKTKQEKENSATQTSGSQVTARRQWLGEERRKAAGDKKPESEAACLIVQRQPMPRNRN